MTSESACGEVPEWSNGAVSKTVVGASLPRVRIPVSPPLNYEKVFKFNAYLMIYSYFIKLILIFFTKKML